MRLRQSWPFWPADTTHAHFGAQVRHDLCSPLRVRIRSLAQGVIHNARDEPPPLKAGDIGQQQHKSSGVPAAGGADKNGLPGSKHLAGEGREIVAEAIYGTTPRAAA